MALLTVPLVRTETISREHRLATGESVTLTVTVRATTPGECCVSIASALPFDYAPPLPEDIAVRFDDRLYDGLYAGLATLAGPLPPEHLKAEVVALTAAPPLATLVGLEDWALVSEIGALLEKLTAEAIMVATNALLADSARVRMEALT